MSVSRVSTDTVRAPHSVSLKVLRLSRPTLSTQCPLPEERSQHAFRIDPKAALAYPATTQDDDFILASGLRLPAAFGSAHVGETFACTLCVNNELSSDSDVEVADVKLIADMQTPLQPDAPIRLDVETALETGGAVPTLRSGETLQGIVRFHLSDEGNFVLAVTVSYTEVQKAEDEDAAPVRRSRTFRKLYQFPASQLIRVRIKTRPIPPALETSHGQGYAVEAQLEKLGDDSLVLESASLNPKAAFGVISLNAWDTGDTNGSVVQRMMLNPGDVLQAAFLLVQNEEEQELTKDGRVLLGQMTIRWRGAMGEPGLLNTGWLSGRR